MKKHSSYIAVVFLMIVVTTALSAQTYFVHDIYTDYRRITFLSDIVELDNGNFAFLANERELPQDPVLPNVYLFDPCGRLITIRQVATDATPNSIPTLTIMGSDILVNGYSGSQDGSNYYAVLGPDSLHIKQELREDSDVFFFGNMQQVDDSILEVTADDEFVLLRRRNLALQSTSNIQIAHNQDSNPQLIDVDDTRVYVNTSDLFLVYDHSLNLVYTIDQSDVNREVVYSNPKVIGPEKIMVGVTVTELTTDETYRAIHVYHGDQLTEEHKYTNWADYHWSASCILSNGLVVCPSEVAIYTFKLDGSPFEVLPIEEEGLFTGILGGISPTRDGGFVMYTKYSVLIEDFWQPVYRLGKADRNFFSSWTPSPGCSVSSKDQVFSELSIFPVPATDFITISSPEGNAAVTIYDTRGNTVAKISASALQQIDISELPSGVYYAQFGSSGQLQKIIKL